MTIEVFSKKIKSIKVVSDKIIIVTKRRYIVNKKGFLHLTEYTRGVKEIYYAIYKKH